MTPPERIGYRLSLVTGKLPAGLTLPADAIEPAAAVTIFIHWDDGATNDQEAIDFTLNVVAIDAAGNESEPRTMKVSDDPGFGCHQQPSESQPSRAIHAAHSHRPSMFVPPRFRRATTSITNRQPPSRRSRSRSDEKPSDASRTTS